jgi:putative FmdB family regulatory protein
MPIYDYKCECGYGFEDLNRISERHQAECIRCGKMADLKIAPVRLDPNMDTPGMRMKWRKAAQRRARGADMTAANKTVEDEGVLRQTHLDRKIKGGGTITTSGGGRTIR